LRYVISIIVVFLIVLGIRHIISQKAPDSIEQGESCTRLNILSFDWNRGDLQITARNVSGMTRATKLSVKCFDKNDKNIGGEGLSGPVRGNDTTTVLEYTTVPHGTVKIIVDCVPD
jgi:hypothetical protein